MQAASGHTSAPTQPSPAPPGQTPAAAGGDAGALDLSPISTRLSGAEIVSRLDELARRGKLAGFTAKAGAAGNAAARQAAGGDAGAALFEIRELGAPFEHVIRARAEGGGDSALSSGGGGGGGGTTLRFEMARLARMPLIFVVVLALTVWPGVWITDSMLKTYFTWYTIETWWWYIPITVLPLPWAWRAIARKSVMTAREDAAKAMATVRSALAG